MTTGINKRIAGQRHACATLKLDTDGTADEVRDRIIAYAKGSNEKDAQVRNIVTRYHSGEKQSQDMFSTESDDENDDSEDEIEEDSIGNSLNGPEKSVINKLTSQIKQWIGEEGVFDGAEQNDDDDPISFINKSFATLTLNGDENVNEDEDKEASPAPAAAAATPAIAAAAAAAVAAAAAATDDEKMDSPFSHLDMEAREVLARKDAQI